jgi:hypothetical protein
VADTWQTVEQAAVALGMSVRTVNRHIAAGKIASRLHEGRREVLVSLPEPESDTLKASVRDAFARLNAAAEAELTDRLETDANLEWSDTSDEIPSVMTDTVSASAEEAPEPTTVHIPSPEPTNADTSSRLGFDAHTVLALADNASDKAEMAVSAYQALARVAEARAEATRRNARFAWSAVAVMAAGVTVAVGWTSHHLTAARAESQYLQQELTVTSAAVSDVRQERDTLRGELSVARESIARSEGKLEAAAQASAHMEAELKRATNEANQVHAPATAPTTRPISVFTRVARLWAD